MKINYTLYWSVFKDMLISDMHVLRQFFLGKLLNRIIWVGSYVIIMSHIMPSFGLSTSYGPFILAGLIASIGLLESFSSTAAIVADLNGDRTITYYLTLPIPASLVFIRMLCFYALEFAMLGMIILPIGSLLLKEPLSFGAISWGKFAIIFTIINLFHGSFILWAASITKNMATISNIMSRLIHPFWFFGGFQFSWHVLHKIWPKLAYLMLLNPVTYTMEGLRAAILGQQDYLPFWGSVVMLTCFTVLLTWNGIVRMKKRLDFV